LILEETKKGKSKPTNAEVQLRNSYMQIIGQAPTSLAVSSYFDHAYRGWNSPSVDWNRVTLSNPDGRLNNSV